MEVKFQLFEPPSGNVRGLVNAFVQLKGKSVRIANATLFTDAEPDIVLSVPKRLSIEGTEAVTRGLAAFTEKVRSLAIDSITANA
ncbi:hypothetical protein [Burkholderia ubonensis]|uniref:hypothetical protein n=1 Tax=Burkholderia ubonensis TaxID=101571 RepID=UPI000A6DB0FF|nr:hypothetical protein [Burkholderia ubonensis]